VGLSLKSTFQTRLSPRSEEEGNTIHNIGFTIYAQLATSQLTASMTSPPVSNTASRALNQGLSLVHFSAQPKPFSSLESPDASHEK
jgi:hypothetical protein